MQPHERLRVTYELTCKVGERPEAIAVRIAYEQTVELPDDCLTDADRDQVVGEIDELEAVADDLWRVVLSYTPDLIGGSLTQLFNLLYGNISLAGGIRLVEVDWPSSVAESFAGPRFGIGGLRDLCGVGEGRPLSCAVAKPIGSSVDQLVDRCRQFTLGGVDLIKDDHSLADQWWAPFYDRVGRCQAAIREANEEVGGTTVYLPTLSGGGAELAKRVEFLHSIGCQGATVLPVYQGWDAVRELAATSDLALLGHPSGSGVFFQDRAGIAPDVLLGQLYRLAGCDVVNFPRAGGRFPLSQVMEARIVHNLQAPMGPVRPASPAPGGSVDVGSISPWLERYGPDAVFVVGASLFRGSGVREMASELAGAVQHL
jgi:ribulose-bisphosphate carboxylase large chain